MFSASTTQHEQLTLVPILAQVRCTKLPYCPHSLLNNKGQYEKNFAEQELEKLAEYLLVGRFF